MRGRVRLVALLLAVAAMFVSAGFVLAQANYQEFAGVLGPGTSMHSPMTQKYYTTYDFTLAPDRNYTFDLMSSEFDAYLILRDSMGREVARDDDSGSGLNARLVYRPPFYGSYRLEVTTYHTNQTGSYRLAMTAISDGGPMPPSGGTFVSTGYLVPGPELWLRPGAYYREHTFAFVPGRTYTIDLESPMVYGGDSQLFDPYLFLVDQWGQVVRSDDDSGGNLNARITNFVPTPGVNYRIFVTSYVQHATGSYRLMIRW